MAILQTSNLKKSAQYLFVKKRNLIVIPSAILFLVLIVQSSCKRINEATELGGELIPPIDNINTFERFFSVETDNKPFYLTDSTEHSFNDAIAVGNITNDPEFGATNAAAYFDVTTPSYTYPFNKPDSVLAIDSVVLSLGYSKAYGDTNSVQTFRVYEIPQNSDFSDTAFYRFNHPTDFVVGAELGSKTFSISSLNDSVTLIHDGDTSKTANVLRIPLSNSLAQRFVDTSILSGGGYKNDTAFKTLLKGLAIKADAGTGNALAYFNINDITKSRLIIYYQVKRGGVVKSEATSFYHVPQIPFIISRNPSNFKHGVANIVRRTPANGWANYLGNGTPDDDKVYIMSAPGSFATIKIPALDTLSKYVVHRAELIATKISPSTDIFAPPSWLFLDRLSPNQDTSYIFQRDLQPGTGLAPFGGNLRSDNTYRFLITRYVQQVISDEIPNHILRIHAPLRTTPRVYGDSIFNAGTIPVLSEIANGRVVLGGGSHPDPNLRMRLRVVYSRL